MMTCLRQVLGYMRLEIWHKIAAFLESDVFAQCYALVVHAAVGLVKYLHSDNVCRGQFFFRSLKMVLLHGPVRQRCF